MTCHCGKPTPESAFICPDCVKQLDDALRNLADHLRHIDDKRARRSSRLWIGRSTPSRETPLPFDARVRDVLEPTRNLLTTWARVVIDEHACRDHLPNRRSEERATRLRAEIRAWDKVAADIAAGEIVVKGDGRGLDAMRESLRWDLSTAILRADLTNLADVADWLAGHAQWIAGREWAQELAGEISEARDAVSRLMDNPPEKVALGECGHEGCTNILTAESGKSIVRCLRCGWDHDVQARRLDLLQEADDLVVSVKEAVRLLRVTGSDVDARDIRAMVHHFGIRPALTTRVPGVKQPVSVYRLGVLREAIDATSADPQTRREVNRARRSA